MPASKAPSKRSPPLHDSLATCQAVSSARPAHEEKEERDAVSANGRPPAGQPVNVRQPDGASVEPANGTSNGTASANGAATSGWSGEELIGYEGKGMQQRLRVAVDVDEVLGSFLSTLNLFCAEKYSVRHELHEFYVYDFMKVWKCSQEEANHRVHDFFKSAHFNDGIPIIPGAFDTLRRLSHFTDLVVVTSRQHVIREPTLEWLDNHFPGVFSSGALRQSLRTRRHTPAQVRDVPELGAEVLIDDNPPYAMECAEKTSFPLYVLLLTLIMRPRPYCPPSARELGAEVLIDDNPRYALECAEHVIQVLLLLFTNPTPPFPLPPSFPPLYRELGAEVLIDDNPRYAMECAEHGIQVLLFDWLLQYPWSKTAGGGPHHELIERVRDWGEVEVAVRRMAVDRAMPWIKEERKNAHR
ncbi:unnamed protein product [Closterium sp. NIES-64]|nr:unnamed protein product [Closterium sp. NIES-64]